ncbi:MAG: elongation factor P [Clostridiales bacterium]|nr:elongation factor P [Clostridiales bacterium]
MISAGDFRKGLTVDIEGQIYTIVEFQHVKPGKGAAFVRTKLKNVITGAVTERTFNPSDKMNRAHIETKEMQYLYSDGELFYFMDNESYEQLPLEKEQVEEALPYIVENTNVTIRLYKGKAFSVQPPNFVILEVVETEPGLRGDTATNVTKQAVLETGATINVPLFINQGEKIRIDTRTHEYMDRA